MTNHITWSEASRQIDSVVPARLETHGNAAKLQRVTNMFGNRDVLTDAGVLSYGATLIGLFQVNSELYSLSEVAYYREPPQSRFRFKKPKWSAERVLAVSALDFDGVDIVRSFNRARLCELSDLQAPNPLRSFAVSAGLDGQIHVDAATQITDRTIASILVSPSDTTATLKVHNPEAHARINLPGSIDDLEIDAMWLPRSTTIYEAFAAIRQGV